MAEKLDTLGDRVRAARLRKGWKQGTLASKAKISQPTVSEIEGNITKDPGGTKLRAIADALGVGLHWLQTGDEGNEADFLDNYRKANPAWQAVLRRLAALPDEEQGRVTSNVLDFVLNPEPPRVESGLNRLRSPQRGAFKRKGVK